MIELKKPEMMQHLTKIKKKITAFQIQNLNDNSERIIIYDNK